MNTPTDLSILNFFLTLLMIGGFAVYWLWYMMQVEGQSPYRLKVKKLDPKARVPARGNRFAAGLDLFLLEGAKLAPGETRLLSTGIAVEIPPGYFGMVRPRSSAFKKGLVIQGTVDSDYRGEVYVVVTNASRVDRIVESEKAIAQMIVVRYDDSAPQPVVKLSDTGRGSNGFGSTGAVGVI